MPIVVVVVVVVSHIDLAHRLKSRPWSQFSAEPFILLTMIVVHTSYMRIYGDADETIHTKYR